MELGNSDVSADLAHSRKRVRVGFYSQHRNVHARRVLWHWTVIKARVTEFVQRSPSLLEEWLSMEQALAGCDKMQVTVWGRVEL